MPMRHPQPHKGHLPRSSGYRAIDLVQGAMPAPDGLAILPLGRTLGRIDVKVLKDAEVPREGVVVRRMSRLVEFG